MPELSVFADYGDACGEAPLWDARSGSLYWSDTLGKKFYRYDWQTGRHGLFKDGLEINSFAFNEPGGFIVNNSEGIWLWDGAGPPQLIAAEVDGAKCLINDCLAAPDGSMFAGSFYYNGEEQYDLGYLIHVRSDGTAAIVDEGFHLANGMAFSPDCSVLYVGDSAVRSIYAYDYDAAGGSLGSRRLFIKVPADEGIPDGLTVDAEGFLWSAQWFGSGVVRYDPDGDVERRVAVPAKQTSSITFGGPDLTDIFITSAALPDALPLVPPGYDPYGGNVGGQLYRLNLGIRGREEFRANILPRGL